MRPPDDFRTISSLMLRAPLTRQIATEGALRRWFEARLPRVDQAAPGLPRRVRAVVPRRRPDALPPWLIGASFDWRLRLGLEVPDDPTATTAFAGWALAFAGGPSGVAVAWPPVDPDPVTLLVEHSVSRGAGMSDASARDEIELARVAVALALYESWYRGGVRVDDPLFQLGPWPDVSALTSLCPTAAAEELAELVAAARHGLASLFPATRVETNPVFDAHGVPADGDLVIDDLLIELKTVTRARLEPEWLWQVIGYFLLDGGGRGIRDVGIYLSRHGCLLRWSLPDLLTRLAGTQVELDAVRAEFEAVIRGGDALSTWAAETGGSRRRWEP